MRGKRKDDLKINKNDKFRTIFVAFYNNYRILETQHTQITTSHDFNSHRLLL